MEIRISKSKLKSRMLEVFRELEAEGGELIVTDHGRPVLKIVPIQAMTTVEALFAELQGRVNYYEDIDTPTTDEWSEV